MSESRGPDLPQSVQLAVLRMSQRFLCFLVFPPSSSLRLSLESPIQNMDRGGSFLTTHLSLQPLSITCLKKSHLKTFNNSLKSFYKVIDKLQKTHCPIFGPPKPLQPYTIHSLQEYERAMALPTPLCLLASASVAPAASGKADRVCACAVRSSAQAYKLVPSNLISGSSRSLQARSSRETSQSNQ